MTGADLVTAVQTEGGLDAERSQALEWINQSYRTLVGRSAWRKAQVSLGPTVAGQAAYVVSDDVADLISMIVTASGEDPGVYRPIGETEIWELQSGIRFSSGSGGWFAASHSSAGVESVQLYPVPTVSGSAITALAAMYPTALADASGSTPVVPTEYHTAIRDGAIGTGLRLLDERLDLSGQYAAMFEAEVERLRRQASTRIGSGVRRLLKAGADF